MFNIDYSRSAEKSAAGEKTRQPGAADKDIDTQTAEHYESYFENLTPEEEAELEEFYYPPYDPDKPEPCCEFF